MRVALMQIHPELRRLGYDGGYDTVRRYAAGWKRARGSGTAGAFVPPVFAPGEAYQFDWSDVVILIDGVTVTVKVAYGQGRKFLDWARKKKIIVHCMGSGEDLAGDKVAAQLMSVLQALEKFEEQLPAIRMRSQERQLKKEGHYLGSRPPFGFLLDGDGMNRPNSAADKAMRLMRCRRAQGVSLRGIAIELNRRGIAISHSGFASALRAADPAAGEGGE